MCFSIQQGRVDTLKITTVVMMMTITITITMMMAGLCVLISVLLFDLFVYKLKPEARRICLHLFRDTAA